MDILLSTDVAVVYARERGYLKLSSASEFLADIGKFMSERLPGSKIDRFAIAAAVLELRAQQAASPEQAAFEQNLAEGTTADDAALQHMDELALAGRVAQMSMADFGAEREKLGLSRSTADFLLGR